MPSHNLDPNDPKNVARLLIALVMEHGGEVRIKAMTYDSYERGRFLIVDIDKASNEIVLRSTSDFGRAIIVPPENANWLRPSEEVERPGIAAQRAVQRRIVRSDEELAALEEARNAEAALARESREGSTTTRFRTETSPVAARTREMEPSE